MFPNLIFLIEKVVKPRRSTLDLWFFFYHHFLWKLMNQIIFLEMEEARLIEW